MARSVRNSKALIAMAIVVAFVAVVIPTCRMVGCSTTMGGAIPFGHQPAPGFFGDCGGEYLVTAVPKAVVPSGLDSLTMALAAAVLLAAALFAPRDRTGALRAVDVVPPPPPEDSRGERLRL